MQNSDQILKDYSFHTITQNIYTKKIVMVIKIHPNNQILICSILALFINNVHSNKPNNLLTIINLTNSVSLVIK